MKRHSIAAFNRSPCGSSSTVSGSLKTYIDLSLPNTPTRSPSRPLSPAIRDDGVTPKSANTTSPKCKSTGGDTKRRRLDSNEENIVVDFARARRLNYERYESDSDSDDDDTFVDPVDEYIEKERREGVLQRIKSLQYDDGEEDALVHKSAGCKLFELVRSEDVAGPGPSSLRTEPNKEASNAKWEYLGSGQVKVSSSNSTLLRMPRCFVLINCQFIKCMEEGYSRGMIRMELVKNGTLDILMRHELTDEEVSIQSHSVPISPDTEPHAHIPHSPLKIFNQSAKKGKAFTWRARDWAHKTSLRTFSIRFVEELDALDWKQQAEQSKANNCNIRKGIDVPEFDDICSILNSANIVD